MGYSLFVSGLTHIDEAKAYPGLTLFTTMTGETFNLIDLQGKVIPSLYSAGEAAGGHQVHGHGKVITAGYTAGTFAAQEQSS